MPIMVSSPNVWCKVNGNWVNNVQKPKVYAVDIAVNVADPYERVTYPQTVTIGGQVYNNACYGYTPGSGTDIGSWAQDYDSGTGLISGIVPGTLDLGGHFTPSSTLTQIPEGSYAYNAMTYFPTWYQCWTNDGNTIRIICCNEQLTSDFKDYPGSLGEVRRGYFCLGCYTSYRASSSGIYSMVGTPVTNQSYQWFLETSQGMGTNYDMMTWFQYEYLAMLCVFIWKSTDLQTAFAGGYVTGGLGVQANTALTTTQYGMAGTPGTNSTDKMAFFWIENLWGNIYQFVGGAHTTSSYKLELNTSLSSTSSWDLQTNQGPNSVLSGAISKVTGTTETGFFPLDDGGSYTTYFADGTLVKSDCFAAVGGLYGLTDRDGPFFVYFDTSASATGPNVGSRLSYRGEVTW